MEIPWTFATLSQRGWETEDLSQFTGPFRNRKQNAYPSPYAGSFQGRCFKKPETQAGTLAAVLSDDILDPFSFFSVFLNKLPLLLIRHVSFYTFFNV